ncbi:MFS transporter [Corallincola holothuriorum]|uniref:MFS transporter n=1 Tax=Corallincola holothuriorum TaxID=2282215 RepID=A0A368MX72_9GAMM|nr:peptide MFS transporter [Corallincola holothuriorum]RCU42867.1 MFS transporter [Corallincola holothuriorum]
MSNTPSQGTLLGHPKGLFLLFGTELWERFSYYAMRAILVLYLVDKVSGQGGNGLGWTEQDAISLYGTFTMLVYLTPLIGGWLADNHLGQRKSILIGGFLMAMGQFTLAMPHGWFVGQENTVFYAGLALLICGNGMFKPNISTMVGDLYEDGDHRRDGAFTIFYMGINIGAFLSGILVASAYQSFGYTEIVNGKEIFVNNYQAGFAAAGFGMLLSLVIQGIFARKLLGDIGTVPVAKLKANQAAKDEGQTGPLSKVERDRIKVIFVLGLFTIVFWAGFEQAGGLMNIYADKFTDRMVGSFEVPTAWFQSINAFFIVLFAPIFASLWIKLGDKEPSSPAKFALGLFLLGLGFLFMVAASMQIAGGDAKASLWWLVGAYLFHTLGELCLSPVGLSMVTKLAPVKLASLFMGLWFFFTGLANYVAGFVGSLIGVHGDGEAFSTQCTAQGITDAVKLTECVDGLKEAAMIDKSLSIFIGLVITGVVSAVILYLISDKLIDWMHGAEDSHPTTEDQALEEEMQVTGTHEAMPETKR